MERTTKRTRLAALGAAALAALGAQAWGAAPAMAQASAGDALRQAEDGTFKSADLNSDGKITRRETVLYTDLVFSSMDGNADDRLSFEEFAVWDTGYAHAARMAGKERAIEDAKRALFAEFDLDGDGWIGFDEKSAATLYYFYKADADRNGSLDRVEFTTGFLIPKTLRAAVR